MYNAHGDVDNSILYAGYQYDEETGLYYINARMYDPVTARFLQADTYAGNVNDPLSLNLYTYCLNNPQKYVDPSGHSVVLAFLLVTAVSGLLGAGMEYVSQKYIEKRDVINYDLILFEGVFNAVIGAASMGMASVGATAVRQAGKLTARTVTRIVAKGAALGAVEGAIENVGRQVVTGASLNNLDYGEVASSAGFSGVVGGMGAAAGVGLDMLKQTRVVRKMVNGVKGKIADVANVLKGRNTGKYFRELDLQFFASDDVYRSSRTSVQPYEVTTFDDFRLRSVVGDGLEGHEVWQHANLNENGYVTTRLSSDASKKNIVMALPHEVHVDVNRAQYSLNARMQSPLDNIKANADILYNHNQIPNSQVDKALEQAIRHYNSIKK